jgi:acyl-CoA thioesterase I
VRAHPDLVTVWLNVNDIFDGVAASNYERDLTRLLQGLAETGAPVLVANTPPLDRLPAYLACRPHPPENTPPCLFGLDPGPPQVLNQIVDDYNAAIRRAARSAGAIVVDLHGAGVLARRSDNAERLVSYDGLHPSTRGHRAVAATFVKALETEGISFGG